jgi:predicted ATP-dependent endonuclease of OLD family
MQLKQVKITGYRSIRNETTLFVEPNVTVILGPNDHGKTNCLNALLHLNDDCPFAEEGDLNWDSADNPEELPSVVAHFTLSQAEIAQILAEENEQNRIHNDEVEKKRAEQAESDGSADPAASRPDPGTTYELLKHEDLIDGIRFRRTGLKGKLDLDIPVSLFESTEKLLFRLVPRFELINPVAKLSDSVTAQELAPDKNEFMRGIFYYAGLDPDDCDALFEQNDRTMRQLTQASKTLDRTLRETWSQGRGLEFKLQHDSKHQRIELLIEDPSVTSRFVRASRRSSGFTHYFALKTILYARQMDNQANSYFLLFDEPGIYLHPSGQYDLLQVLETLALESQLAYVTHSLFMINKTFPTRHRLLMKGDGGTTLDGKPYVGRWQAVLNSLGMAVTGTILFANYAILTEGDSDPIYLYAMLQKGVLTEKCRIDLNSLAFISTGESKHADVLLRLLYETVPRPTIGVITDGDQGGKERLVYLNALIKDQDVAERSLTKDTSIEDHMPNLREVYVPAVADFVGKLIPLKGGNKPDEADLREKFLDHFDKTYEKGKVTTKVSEWAAKAAADIGGLTSKPSKVGIAREYAMRLLAFPDGQLRWDDRAKAMVEWLIKKVGVPELSVVAKTVLQDD